MGIKWIVNGNVKQSDKTQTPLDCFSQEEIKSVRLFINYFKEYKPTPLVKLGSLAKEMGIENIWIKDESYRFGLNAFKVLGGAYAIGKYLSKKLGMDSNELSFEKLCSKEIKKKIGELVFVSATDGNHGRGVAWAANRLGQKSVIFMPKGSAKARLENIRKEGAEAEITEYNYDEAVEYAKKYAEKHNGVMVQDTDWEGYKEIPTWIMQGYAVIADEISEQLKVQGVEKPTHIFLQAGVGSFASSIQGYYSAKYGDQSPISVIVEPEGAACIFKSASINDGNPHTVKGDLDTIMAGLACGKPNTMSWDILRDYSNMYVSCPDYVAARGMRILANPLGIDFKVVSGESGAVGLGLFSILTQKEKYQDILELLKIDQNSRVLFISTEGATDPLGYRQIVWDGYHPMPVEQNTY
ncbi:MAG: diaminopropionate ammonia-lyase [Clostridia bacterium]|nr:diaminopropionate ammonia-lyase [Clostridia bacterium]